MTTRGISEDLAGSWSVDMRTERLQCGGAGQGGPTLCPGMPLGDHEVTMDSTRPSRDGDESRPSLADGRSGAASAAPDITPSLSPDVLVRHNARVLDPVSAVVEPALTHVADPPPVRSTVYIAHHLLVRNASPGSPAFDALRKAAARYGLEVEPDERDARVHEHAQAAEIEDYPEPVSLVRLVAKADEDARPAPDAWAVLQTYRGLIGSDAAERADVGLDHLLT